MTRTAISRKDAGPEAKDYRSYSFWLETAGEDLTPRPSLPGPTRGRRGHTGRGLHGPLDGVLSAPAGPFVARGGAGVGDRWLRGFGTQRGLVQLGLSRDPRGARAALRQGGHEGALARDAGRGRRDRQGRRGGGDRRPVLPRRAAPRRPRARASCPLYEEAYESAQSSVWRKTSRLLDAEETAERIRITGARGRAVQSALRDHPPGAARARARQGRRAPGR